MLRSASWSVTNSLNNATNAALMTLEQPVPAGWLAVLNNLAFCNSCSSSSSSSSPQERAFPNAAVRSRTASNWTCTSVGSQAFHDDVLVAPVAQPATLKSLWCSSKNKQGRRCVQKEHCWQQQRKQQQQRWQQHPGSSNNSTACVLQPRPLHPSLWRNSWSCSHSRSSGNFTQAGYSSNSSNSSSSSSRGSSANPELGFIHGGYTPDMFPPERIRNFCIIAHIDHGKSTLADRLMQMTGAVPAGSRPQYLDKLQVERERGITIKAQTASLVHRHSDGHDYLLNLIDTPGHVDFSYEVSRSLAACQGALLLVDASQGVQAQTVANFYLAFEQELALLPLLNKVDLPSADPAAAAAQLVSTFDVAEGDVLAVSAKTGLGLTELLPAIIERIPAPAGHPDQPLRALLFDAFHDEYRGVVCLVAVVDGCLKAGDRLAAASTGQEYEALEVGVLAPEAHPTGQLLTGQVGYVIPGIKDVQAARVGDTWHLARQPVQPLPGFKPIKPMVFAGLYPASADEYEGLASAIERLNLNDASVTVKKETSDALGAGFRCGFLGPLHLEVFLQRLQQEHKADVISTAPTVPYEVELAADPQQQQQQQEAGGDRERQRLVLESVAEYPRNQKVAVIYEPTVLATIIVPQQYCGNVMKLTVQRRGTQLEYNFLGGSSAAGSTTGSTSAAEATVADLASSTSSSSGSTTGSSDSSTAAAAAADTNAVSTSGSGGGFLASDRVLLRYQLPLSELAGDFYSKLKSATQGYASFDYEEGPLRPADLTLLELLVNGKPVDALGRLVPSADASRLGRQLASRMKELLDRQQYEVVIQAAAGGRIVARETLKALRKDVLAKCYGGDVSRKRKLLQKQKEGKKRLRQLGGLSVPAEILPELLKP